MTITKRMSHDIVIRQVLKSDTVKITQGKGAGMTNIGKKTIILNCMVRTGCTERCHFGKCHVDLGGRAVWVTEI